MEKLQWTDELSIGIQLIDDQHKKWIEHFNNAVDAIANKRAAAQVSKTIDFLIDYTDEHFATEEKCMTEQNYPELDAHKAKHEELRKTLSSMTSEFKDEGPTPILTDAVENLLGNWLIKHIKEVDMKFAAFLK